MAMITSCQPPCVACAESSAGSMYTPSPVDPLDVERPNDSSAPPQAVQLNRPLRSLFVSSGSFDGAAGALGGACDSGELTGLVCCWVRE